jgi:hypothetical protein
VVGVTALLEGVTALLVGVTMLVGLLVGIPMVLVGVTMVLVGVPAYCSHSLAVCEHLPVYLSGRWLTVSQMLLTMLPTFHNGVSHTSRRTQSPKHSVTEILSTVINHHYTLPVPLSEEAKRFSNVPAPPVAPRPSLTSTILGLPSAMYTRGCDLDHDVVGF